MLLLGGSVRMSPWAGDNAAGSEAIIIIAEGVLAPLPPMIWCPGGELSPLLPGASHQKESLADVYQAENIEAHPDHT